MIVSTSSDLMEALGWQQNMTFTHNDIGFVTYLRLLSRMTPPVSELYLGGVPADSAFQLPGTLKTREHIRWWKRGAGVHLGAICQYALKTDPLFASKIDPLAM